MSIEKFSGQFKNESKGCTVVINSTIQSITKFDVLGLYVYLCSKFESWQPNAKEIMNHTGYSKDKTYRLINELIKTGLMTCRTIRDKGRFIHYEYTVHLHPQGFKPFPEKQDTEKQDTENQDAYKTKNIENKEYKDTISDFDKSPSNNKKPIISIQEIIDIYHRVLPECPKIRTPSDELKRLIKNMVNRWNELNDDNEKFSLEAFEGYLMSLQLYQPGFLIPYMTKHGNQRRNNLETLIRFDTMANFRNERFDFTNKKRN